jgi:hypothetical protein
MRANFGFDAMWKYLILPCLLAFIATAASTADIPNFPKARPAPAARDNGLPAAQGNGLPASCLEWTDGCRVCARQKDGSDACSNVGIACVLQKARCTRQ